MNKKQTIFIAIVSATVFAALGDFPVIAQRGGGGFHGGGGGFHGGGGFGGGFHAPASGFHMGGEAFGGGSITHRNFSPPAGFSRPNLSPNFERAPIPHYQNFADHPDFRAGTGAAAVRNFKPDVVRPGMDGHGIEGHSFDRPAPRINPRPSEPDWKHWDNFTPSKIDGSVINRPPISQGTVDRIRGNFNDHVSQHGDFSPKWYDNHPEAWRPGHHPDPGPGPGPGPHPNPPGPPGPHPDPPGPPGPHPGPPGPPGPHPPGPPGPPPPPPPPPPPTWWWGDPGWEYAWGWMDPGFLTGYNSGEVIDPCPYNYGSNVVYEGDTVYVNGVPYVGADEYYQQAQDIANTGAEEPPVEDAGAAEGDATGSATAAAATADSNEWLPMGTFAVVADDKQKDSKRILQIATNKHGLIRGNLINQDTDETVELYGSVDPKTQRVAFKLRGNDDVVAECGFWNLTQETVPLLVHIGRDKTEERTLIRLKGDKAATETKTVTETPAAPKSETKTAK